MLFEWKKKDRSKILEKMDKSPNLYPYYMRDSGMQREPRGQNRLRLRAGFFFAALKPPVGAGGSDPSSQP